MVRYGRSKTAQETKLYFEKLLNLQGVDSREIEKKQYSLYQKWYHTAIWAMLGYYRFSGDFRALSKKLSPEITAKQAKESIHLLTDLGFIRKNEEGFFEFTSEKITTGEKWHSAAIHSFQKETIKMAGESLDRHVKDIRDISTVTIAVNQKDLEEIKERAKDFRQSLLQLKSDTDNMDVVYQVNIQVIPLTIAGKD